MYCSAFFLGAFALPLQSIKAKGRLFCGKILCTWGAHAALRCSLFVTTFYSDPTFTNIIIN